MREILAGRQDRNVVGIDRAERVVLKHEERNTVAPHRGFEG